MQLLQYHLLSARQHPVFFKFHLRYQCFQLLLEIQPLAKLGRVGNTEMCNFQKRFEIGRAESSIMREIVKAAAKAFKIIDFPLFSRSLCEDQTFRCQRKENWKEEEDDGEKCQSESVLQRVICLHGGPKYVKRFPKIVCLPKSQDGNVTKPRFEYRVCIFSFSDCRSVDLQDKQKIYAQAPQYFLSQICIYQTEIGWPVRIFHT